MAEFSKKPTGPRIRSADERVRPPWHRHLPWLVLAGACVVFGVLIAGAIGVRKVILITRPAAPPPNASNAVSQGEATSSETARVVDATRPDGSGNNEPPPPVAATPRTGQPAGPVLDVLPPAAAAEQGRKLPRLLLVGDSADMFADLNAALDACIPGDTIEIRTNRPILVRPHKLKREKDSPAAPLTIRGGHRFEPILRMPLGSGITSDGVALQIERIHFVTPPKYGGVWLFQTNSSVRAQYCSQTDFPGTHEQFRNFVATRFVETTPDPGMKLDFDFENCFFRGSFVLCHLVDGSCHVTIRNCLGVLGYYAVALRGAESQKEDPQTREVIISHCTVVGSWGAISLSLEGPPQYMGKRIIECPVRVECTGNILQPSANVLALNNYVSEEFRNYIRSGALSWRGARNVFPPRIPLSELALGEHVPAANRVRPVATSLAEWHTLWPTPTDQSSRVAKVEFTGGLSVEQFARSLPQHFTVKSVEGLRPEEWRGIGCDVTKLPVPPPATLEHYEPAEPKKEATKK